MKRNLCGALTVVLFIVMVSPSTRPNDYAPPENTLDTHRKFSAYTDPGEYGYLFGDLPESLTGLCGRIKGQLIHPYDTEKYAGELPEERTFEDRKYPTVALMLEELLKRDGRGLTASREPRDRLIVACVHHNMLLASILRHRGIPVRIRAGFATYIGGKRNLRVTHVICEVWDGEHEKWILVDPDRERIDFPRSEFEYAHEVWRRIRNGDLGNGRYISRLGSVDRAVVHLLCHDLSYIIGDEEPYWKDPPVVSHIDEGIEELSPAELDALDRVAEFLESPDDHLEDLERIQAETPFLRFGSKE